jgi:hypothetical protein
MEITKEEAKDFYEAAKDAFATKGEPCVYFYEGKVHFNWSNPMFGTDKVVLEGKAEVLLDQEDLKSLVKYTRNRAVNLMRKTINEKLIEIAYI